MTIDVDKVYKERQSARQAVDSLVQKAAALDKALSLVENCYSDFVQEEARYAEAIAKQVDNKGVVNRVGNDLDTIATSALLCSAPRLGAILALNPRLAKRDVSRARSAVLKRIPELYNPEAA